MARTAWLLLGFLPFSACKCGSEKTAETAQKPPALELPNTPETVALKWQDAINENRFDIARALSNDRTKAWVFELDSLMHDPQMMDAALPKTVLEELKCRFRNDTFAVCSYFTTDSEDGSRWQDSLYVLKIKGQWLVELPEDEAETTDPEQIEDIEMPFPGENLKK